MLKLLVNADRAHQRGCVCNMELARMAEQNPNSALAQALAQSNVVELTPEQGATPAVTAPAPVPEHSRESCSLTSILALLRRLRWMKLRRS